MRAVSSCRRARHIQGFGLIEVMVSLVVIAVGLLGVAKLNALAIGNTRNSGSRAVAAIYAGSLSAAMHANGLYWQTAGTATAGVTATGGTLTVDSTLAAQTADCAYSSTNTAPSCSAVQMAAHDLRGWSVSLQQLPTGSGTVACSPATTPVTAPVTCTITVYWTEKTIANNAAVNSASQPATQHLIALVQP
jgi:type IV pilus assembly protein PilV